MPRTPTLPQNRCLSTILVLPKANQRAIKHIINLREASRWPTNQLTSPSCLLLRQSASQCNREHALRDILSWKIHSTGTQAWWILLRVVFQVVKPVHVFASCLPLPSFTIPNKVSTKRLFTACMTTAPSMISLLSNASYRTRETKWRVYSLATETLWTQV